MIRLGPGLSAVLGIALIAAVGFGLMTYGNARHAAGYTEGYATRDAEAEAARAAAQAKIDALAAQARDAARDLEEAEAHTATLLEELANAARDDPDGFRLSADSVRRLNAVSGGGDHVDSPAP